MLVLERVLSVLTSTAGLVWVASVCLFGSDAGVSFPATIALVCGGGAVLLIWALRLLLHLALTRRAPDRRRIRRLVAEPLVLVLCFAFSYSGAAFWVRFMLSQPSLNRYVHTASLKIAPESFTPGVRIGLFLAARSGGSTSRRGAHHHGGLRAQSLWFGVQPRRCTARHWRGCVHCLGRRLVPLVSQLVASGRGRTKS